jgi:hypothetical protein
MEFMAAAPGPGDKQLLWALRDFASFAILISVMSHCESAALVNFSAFLVFYFSWLCWAEQHLFCLSLPSPTIAPKVLTPKSAHTIRFKLPTFYCGFWMDTWQEVCILVVYVCISLHPNDKSQNLRLICEELMYNLDQRHWQTSNCTKHSSLFCFLIFIQNFRWWGAESGCFQRSANIV